MEEEMEVEEEAEEGELVDEDAAVAEEPVVVVVEVLRMEAASGRGAVAAGTERLIETGGLLTLVLIVRVYFSVYFNVFGF